jgi:ubiquinone/menaquinone biosynthesis C-methylase UbiE
MSALAERVAAVGFDYAAQPKEPVPDCPLCGPGHDVEAAQRDRYGYPARLVVCGGCGLGRLSPRMTEEAYSSFYAGVYRPLVSAWHDRLIDATTVQEDQRGYAADLVEYLRGALPRPPASVLDIGGSTGVVTSAVAAAFRCRATVLDPSPDELAVAAAAGLETIAGFAERLDTDGREFDLILVCQTLDHLLDPLATLRAARRMLAPGGRAFVDVVDLELAVERLGALEHAVKVDHPWYFSRANAAAMCAEAGLQVVGERETADGHRGFLLA